MSNSHHPLRNPSPDDPSLLSSEQVAAKLNISSRCVLNWLYSGIIPAAVHVGKVIRFREADVMKALAKASEQVRDLSNPDEIVHLALWSAAPDVIYEPSWLLLRDPTSEEADLAEKVAVTYRMRMEALDAPEERMNFVKGTMDAIYLEKQGFWKK
jgi:excisionase family DNA binding protein